MNRDRTLRICTCVLALLLLAVTGGAPARGSTASFFWSKTYGDELGDYGAAVAVDASGNIFFAGARDTSFVMSAIPTNDRNGYIAKFTPDGHQAWGLWLKDPNYGSFQTYYPQEVHTLAVDPSGNLYAAGRFEGTMVLGNGVTLAAGGTGLNFIAKFDANGTALWAHSFTGQPEWFIFDDGVGIAADASGAYVSGHFQGTIDFGAGPFGSAGSLDIFLARYDTNGNYSWGKTFGAAGSDVGNDVALDPSGNVLITGRYTQSFQFDPSATALPYTGGTGMFVAKFTSAGAHAWSQGHGSNATAYGVAADASGNAIVVGEFKYSLNLGGSNLSGYLNTSDVFVGKLDPNGAHIWSEGFAGTAHDQAHGVAVDAADNIYLAGYFGVYTGEVGNTIDMGGAPLVSHGEADVLVASLDPDGNPRWSGGYGGPLSDHGVDIASDAAGNVVVSGDFLDSIEFPGTTYEAAGAEDIYIARFGALGADPVIESIVDVGNDQGRAVKIAFQRSGTDIDGPALPVVRYDAYRRDPDLVHWQYVASVPAHGEPEYLIGAPTSADSTLAGGIYYSVFLIRAVTNDEYYFFDSAADSGYSVDNLEPAVPGGFVFAAGQLSWEASPADDFDHFTVYGSAHDRLDASAVVIVVTTDTHANVSDAVHTYYFVTASDHAGNESAAAGSSPGGNSARYTLAVNAYPNPFNPATTIRYDVPSTGRVVVTIFDATGSRVTTLVDAVRDTGSYATRWDGRDERGAPVSSGVYFVRVRFGSDSTTRKMTLVK